MIKYIGRIIKMSIDKENLQKQIEEMKVKLADMEAELNKPEGGAYYWHPKKDGEAYYYVTEKGSVNRYRYGADVYPDRYRVFKTKVEAQKYAECVKAEETLRRVITEVNEGWIPEWNGYDAKYVIGFVFKTKHIKVLTYMEDKLFPNFMYIKSRELAEKLIQDYKKEFITYLSY